jgi:hypothetical protein
MSELTDPVSRAVRLYLRHRRPRTIEQHVEAALGERIAVCIQTQRWPVGLCEGYESAELASEMHAAERYLAASQSAECWQALPWWKRWLELVKG